MQFYKLPYGYGDLAPALNEDAVRRHYEDNHRKYFDKMLGLLPSTKVSLESVLSQAPVSTPLYQNTAQYVIHNFWWAGLTPDAQPLPSWLLPSSTHKSVASLRRAWQDVGSAHFGSGWLWILLREDGKIFFQATPDANFPIAHRRLHVTDLWEHAYYCQYGTNRAEYLRKLWSKINWREVEMRAKVRFRA